MVGPDHIESSAPAGAETATEDERRVERLLFWLVIMPFTAPMWFSLRRTRPDLAEPVRWAMWLNVGQSILLVIVVALAWWAIVALPPLIERATGTWLGL